MTVKEFIKTANPKTVYKIFKRDYNLSRPGLTERLGQFLTTVQTIKPSGKVGIIQVKKFHEVTSKDELNIYIHSSLIIPDDKAVYGYFDQDWADILSYEVVVEDGISIEEAQANIIFEMTYFGTDKKDRKENIKVSLH